MLAIRKPYLLFIGDVPEIGYAKTAFGLKDWCPDDCIGQLALPGTSLDLGLPRLTPAQAAAAGAKSMVIGVAPVGGALPGHWEDTLVAALAAGLDLVAGLHDRLGRNPRLVEAASAHGRQLVDVREPPSGIPIATGRKRSGKRLLTVGTDCALGKKYSALAIQRELAARGVSASFRATGQTGIMIAGAGIPIDAVISDFVAGAAEAISPDAPADHWDIVEGQGSLFHPAYAGVTLGLLHGSQPDAMILCHQPGRTRILGFPDFPIPSLPLAISRYEEAARLTNPAARTVGISLNTAGLSDAARADAFARASDETGLPACDPMGGGVGPIADLLLRAS
jgi:uncharacterized NAD-dependent epimerase/dehydratase family protein